MKTIVIQTHTQSDMKLLIALAKRIGAPAMTINTEELENACLVSLIEEGLKTETVSKEEVMEALKS
jgi:hypothetical protein